MSAQKNIAAQTYASIGGIFYFLNYRFVFGYC